MPDMVGAGFQTYRRTDVVTADPKKLVIMCYEGALHSLKTARVKYAAKEYEAKANAIQNALDILNELGVALDFEKGGGIARNLKSLYSFWITNIIKGDQHRDLSVLDQVATMIEEIKSALEEAYFGSEGSRRCPSPSPNPFPIPQEERGIIPHRDFKCPPEKARYESRTLRRNSRCGRRKDKRPEGFSRVYGGPPKAAEAQKPGGHSPFAGGTESFDSKDGTGRPGNRPGSARSLSRAKYFRSSPEAIGFDGWGNVGSAPGDCGIGPSVLPRRPSVERGDPRRIEPIPKEFPGGPFICGSPGFPTPFYGCPGMNDDRHRIFFHLSRQRGLFGSL